MTTHPPSKTLVVIGTGAVGTAIGLLLKKAGYQITGLYDKSAAAARKAYGYLGGRILKNPQEGSERASFLLIATPDDAIAETSEQIARSPFIKGKWVFHVSGACNLDVLDSAKKAGASVASIHPLQSLSSIENAVRIIPGSYFGVTSDRNALKTAKQIVHDLKGIPLVISPNQKVLYHAAACLASNYLVTLLDAVENVYQTIGIREKNARKAYLPLVYGSLKNIEKGGPLLSLTGPIARGDIGTVQKHVAAFKRNLPHYTPLYALMGLLTLELAQRKGTFNSKHAKKLKDLLKGASK